MEEGGSRNGASLSEEAQCGGPVRGAPLLGPWKICQERLRTRAHLRPRGTWNQEGKGARIPGTVNDE